MRAFYVAHKLNANCLQLKNTHVTISHMQRRNTKNKERILSLFEHKHMLSAQDVCTHLPDLTVSTVYRNIERFVEDGILRKVSTDPHTVSYELTTDIHDHFVCDSCSTIEKVHPSPATLRSLIPSGAKVTEGGLIVHGTCRKCTINTN
jgi:Fur family peroxide stress response transcriptional regulator